MILSFIDTNIWLYRLFDDQSIAAKERERKRNIAISITNQSNLIISTQVINEISANLIKKAKIDENQIKAVIQSLYNRCQVDCINSPTRHDKPVANNNRRGFHGDSTQPNCTVSQ